MLPLLRLAGNKEEHIFREAVEFASSIDSKNVLIDGEQLTQYMIDNNLGVTPVSSYEIKKIDSDYFIED